MRHALTHLPRRAWCTHCVRGAGTDDRHWRRALDRNRWPEWQLDYCFLTREGLSEDESRDCVTILHMVEVQYGMHHAIVADKTTAEYIVSSVVHAIAEVGHTTVLLRTDAEHAITAVAKAVRTARAPLETQLEVAPVGSHASIGVVERGNRTLGEQIRVMRGQLESRLGLTLALQHTLVVWLVRHAAWLLCRFLVKTDGRTPFERTKGKVYSGEIAEFGECLEFHVKKVQKWDD
eukprot:6475206-Amphidinium_carterae.1